MNNLHFLKNVARLCLHLPLNENIMPIHSTCMIFMLNFDIRPLNNNATKFSFEQKISNGHKTVCYALKILDVQFYKLKNKYERSFHSSAITPKNYRCHTCGEIFIDFMHSSLMEYIPQQINNA